MDKLKEIMQLKGNIRLDDLEYAANDKKCSFIEYSLPVVSLRDIHERSFSLKDPDEEQSKLGN